MLLCKFKSVDDNRINYLYLDDKDKNLFGFSAENGRLKDFEKDKFNVLLNALYVNDNSVLLFEYRGYKVYYDQKTRFRHYVKDGKENMYLFFLNNGEDALVYNESNEFDLPGVKMFVVAGIAFIMGIASLSLCYGSDGLDDYIINKYFGDNVFETSMLENINEVSEFLTVDEMIQYINDSPYLDDESKQLFSNRKLFEAIRPYYQGTYMQDEIKNKLKDISIKRYTRGKDDSMAGYYSSLNPSVINVAEDLSEEKHDTNYDSAYNDVKKHEFIHLLQADFFEYTYIQEALTEIIAEEYYKPYSRTWDYSKAVNNVKLFIDIIGPEPFMKGVFGGDTSDLIKVLSDNLSYSDFSKLTKLLKVKPDEMLDEQHSEINSLLCKLYKNMYDDDIRNDGNILYEIFYEEHDYSYFSFVNDNRVFLNKDKIFDDLEINVNIGAFMRIVPDNSIITTKEMEVIRKQIGVDEYFELSKGDVECTYLSNTIHGVVKKDDDCFVLYDDVVYRGEGIEYGTAVESMSIDDAVLTGYVSPYRVSLKEKEEVMPEGWEYTGMYGNALTRKIYSSQIPNGRVEGDKLVVSTRGIGERFLLDDSLKSENKATRSK